MTQLPMIHLNGTSGQVLAREYANALRAVDDAIAALNELTVHGRDYYPIGPRAIDDALAEHHARLIELTTIRRDLTRIYHSIVDQTARRIGGPGTWTAMDSNGQQRTATDSNDPDDFDPGDRSGAFRND